MSQAKHITTSSSHFLIISTQAAPTNHFRSERPLSCLNTDIAPLQKNFQHLRPDITVQQTTAGKKGEKTEKYPHVYREQLHQEIRKRIKSSSGKGERLGAP